MADKSITMEIVSPPMTNFRTWLRGETMNIDHMKKMPFLVEWYEYAFDCYLDAGKRGVYTQQCRLNQDITTAPNYEETPYTQFIISATYAVSRAIHKALEDYCGVGYDGVCWQFRAAVDVREKILGYIRDAEFQLENNQLFKIKDGEGVSNYEVYSYNDGPGYVKVNLTYFAVECRNHPVCSEDRSWQKLLTQIRLLLWEQSDQIDRWREGGRDEWVD